MPEMKVKKGFEDKVIGFNNSSLPLGKRNDLHLLVAKANGDKSKFGYLLDMFDFDTIPTPEEVDDIRVDSFEEKQAKKNFRKDTLEA